MCWNRNRVRAVLPENGQKSFLGIRGILADRHMVRTQSLEEHGQGSTFHQGSINAKALGQGPE